MGRFAAARVLYGRTQLRETGWFVKGEQKRRVPDNTLEISRACWSCQSSAPTFATWSDRRARPAGNRPREASRRTMMGSTGHRGERVFAPSGVHAEPQRPHGERFDSHGSNVCSAPLVPSPRSWAFARLTGSAQRALTSEAPSAVQSWQPSARWGGAGPDFNTSSPSISYTAAPQPRPGNPAADWSR